MKVLVICGGGVFGLVPAYLLNKMEGSNKLTNWDAFGGTSVGSQLVLSYANGMRADSMYNTFSKDMYAIFKRSFLSILNPFGPKYKDEDLNEALKKVIPGLFGSIEKPIFVPAFDFQASVPKIFDNLNDSFDSALFGWEVARMSSAAPTYFNPYRGYIDGGIVANNPVLITTWGLHKKLNIPYEEMEVLVIGTALNPVAQHSGTKRWTALQWIRPLMSDFIFGNESIAHFGAQRMPFKKYKYFPGITMEKGWGIDDPSLEDAILTKTDNMLDEFEKIYEEF